MSTRISVKHEALEGFIHSVEVWEKESHCRRLCDLFRGHRRSRSSRWGTVTAGNHCVASSRRSEAIQFDSVEHCARKAASGNEKMERSVC
jgi:hypothetical protein